MFAQVRSRLVEVEQEIKDRMNEPTKELLQVLHNKKALGLINEVNEEAKKDLLKSREFEEN